MSLSQQLLSRRPHMLMIMMSGDRHAVGRKGQDLWPAHPRADGRVGQEQGRTYRWIGGDRPHNLITRMPGELMAAGYNAAKFNVTEELQYIDSYAPGGSHRRAGRPDCATPSAPRLTWATTAASTADGPSCWKWSTCPDLCPEDAVVSAHNRQ